MDLVKMITSVEFAEVRRGLDRDEVAAFLQQVANAVSAMERRLAEANARAERAESRALDLADDTSLRKTLVLAQRTADAAIAEAQDEARALLLDAEQRATSRMAEADAHAERSRTVAEEEAATTVTGAQQRAAALLTEAKADARKASGELRARLRAEVIELEAARDSLLRDVALFEAHMGEQRTRVQGALGALQMVLDHPDALRRMAIPPLTAVAVPAPVDVIEDELGDALVTAAKQPGMSFAAADMTIDDDEFVIDLVDHSPEIPILDDEIELRVGQVDPITSEVPLVSALAESGDDELVKSFFEQSTFADERWKPRKDRRRPV